MFDKLLFDRNAFDRSVSSDGISITMLGSGKLTLSIRVGTPITASIHGTGAIVSGIRMRQDVGKTFTGSGNLNSFSMVLRRSTTIPLSGSGALIPNFVVRTPIAAALSGHSFMGVDSRMWFYQQMRATLAGNGSLVLSSVFSTAIAGSFSGSGKMETQVGLQLPLPQIDLTSHGTFNLRRLGALSENVIELININLLPGETITIDTDLLEVLFGSVEDVSSVTNDSIFFELSPGENEVTIDVDAGTTMDVTAIWQNRWL